MPRRPLRKDELIEKMRTALGLTRYEALLYLALLQGASSPREASIQSGVPLPRIYDVVRTLEAKGFVSKSPEGWYRAMPPRAIATSVLARIEEESRKRARKVAEAVEELELLAGRLEVSPGALVIEGFYNIVSNAVEIASNSGKVYLLFTTGLGRGESFLRTIITGFADVMPRISTRVLVAGKEILGNETLEFIEQLGGEVRQSPCVQVDMIAGSSGVLVVLQLHDNMTGFRVTPGIPGLLKRLDIIWDSCTQPLTKNG
ncbi:MAG: hypothetical protein F7C32_03470 [Desulfurococcales archaeon]|nr:hypothetical protein [Desulfurococcales archaeon]